MTTSSFIEFDRPPACRARLKASATNLRPIVTVVTPYYNAGSEFRDTTRSILAQTLRAFEWLIVDDGSTSDESLERLREVEKADPRVRIVRHERNLGLSAARNTGFAHASTEAVFMIDADDEIEPTALEKCFWYLCSFGDASFCTGYSVGFGAHEYKWRRGFHDASAFLAENPVNATCMISRSVHQAVGGFAVERRGGLEDWEFWLRCADEGYWGGTIPEYLDWYRRRENHSERWAEFGRSGIEEFTAEIPRKFGRLAKGQFPRPGGFRRPPCPIRASLDDVEAAEPRPERVLFLFPWASLGGADFFNVNLIRSLTALGIECSVVFTEGSRDDREHEFHALTDDVFCLPKFLDRKDFAGFVDYMIRSRGIGRVVVSNSELGYAMLARIRENHPHVVTVDYNHMEEEWWMEGGYPRLAVENTQYLDRHLVASGHLKDWLVRRGVDAGAVEVVYITVDVDRFQRNMQARADFRTRHGLAEDDLAICFSGRLVPQKQPDVLGRTIAAVLPRARNARFFICGSGPREAVLREQLKEHVGAGCHFLGDVSFADMPGVYSGMDVLFLPSLHEGISLAIYEAMAASCAIVGARVGGQAELVGPDAGFLIDSPALSKREQAARYADILGDLAAEPARAAEMGGKGRETVVRGFSQDRLGACFLAALPDASSPPRPVLLKERHTLPVEAVLSKVVSQAALLAATANPDWRQARDSSSRLLRLKWYLVDHHPALAERLAPVYRKLVRWSKRARA